MVASALNYREPEDERQGAVSSYVARQPIYNGTGEVEAYEILYRSGTANHAGEVGLEESSTLLADTLGTFGLDGLVGSKRAFLNISEDSLLAGGLNMLPANRVVLEILETVRPSSETISAVEQLKKDGYLLALDDYTGQPELEAFLPLVKIVKFEVLEAKAEEVGPRARALKSQGKLLLAEKVETRQDFLNWKELGFALFQGYFFAKPEIVEGKGAACNHAALVSLLARLQDPDAGIPEIEQLISCDAGLSYRMMRMLHSAAMGLPTKLNSVREAIMFIGLKRTSAMATVLMLSNVPKKSPEILQVALVRAFFAESLAKVNKLQSPDAHFTLGLFSMLDALLDRPMDELMAELPLSDNVSQALIEPRTDSDYGRMLSFVLDWERGEPELSTNLFNPETSSRMYVSALQKATDIMNGVKQP